MFATEWNCVPREQKMHHQVGVDRIPESMHVNENGRQLHEDPWAKAREEE